MISFFSCGNLSPYLLCSLAGTLQQAIMSEVAFRTATAWPYLIMTDAKNTSNAKLAVSISLFQALGAPLGAWLLIVLDQKRLELSLAGALFVVLLVQGLSAWLIPAQPTGDDKAAASQAAGGGDDDGRTGGSKSRKGTVSGTTQIEEQGDLHEPLLFASEPSVLGDVPRDSVNRLWQPAVPTGSATAQQAGPTDTHASSPPPPAPHWHQVVTVHAAQKTADGAAALQADTDSEGVLLSPTSSDADPEQALGSSSNSSSTGGCCSTCSSQEAKQWAVLLGVGSLAGSLSGV
jgi:hypothetical protein